MYGLEVATYSRECGRSRAERVVLMSRVTRPRTAVATLLISLGVIGTVLGANAGWTELIWVGPVSMLAGGLVGATLDRVLPASRPSRERGPLWRWLAYRGRGAYIFGTILWWAVIALLEHRAVVLAGLSAAGVLIGLFAFGLTDTSSARRFGRSGGHGEGTHDAARIDVAP